MIENPSDHRRDQQRMERLKIIADGIFNRYGINFSDARRAGGWTNATWIAGGLVLRLSVEPGKNDLRREAQITAYFPQEVGYPEVKKIGVAEGYEWCLFWLLLKGERGTGPGPVILNKR